MFYNQKDLHAKSEMGRGHACGMKKDAKDECIEEYFGTLRTLWLVMNKFEPFIVYKPGHCRINQPISQRKHNVCAWMFVITSK